MRAMCLERIGPIDGRERLLELRDRPVPEPAAGRVRLRVLVCGVCHTELDEIEGRTRPPRLPVVPGHQVVGVVDALGAGVDRTWWGRRVGVAWIHGACGSCPACRRGEENLCPDFVATGRDVDGGYAEAMVAPVAFVHPLPDGLDEARVAPLLCAGAVGGRALQRCGLQDGDRLGLSGFGASAQLVLPLVRHLRRDVHVHVFARRPATRQWALEMGADSAGSFDDAPPFPLDAVIDTTPAWKPVLRSLESLRPGGRLVVNAIGKEEADRAALLGLDYCRHLWLEKHLISVANVTRADVEGFLRAALEAPILPRVEEWALEEADAALRSLRGGGVKRAKVLRIASP